MQALKADFPLALLLDVAGLPRSTFFYHQARTTTVDRHAALDAAIRAAVIRSRGRYGHRRIHRALQTAGHRVAKKTVLARMQVLGLRCQVRRRKRISASRGELGTTAANILDRRFTASRPNQTWVTDLTMFRIGEDTLYLSPVMDLYDRSLVAWRIGPSPTVTLATTSLRDALASLGPGEQPLVHTDQGFQYRHRAWQAMLTAAGATPSMSRKGNCLDNAVIESFFGHLKSELLLETFPTIAALETGLHTYLHWYNHDRTSSVLDGLSPLQFRQRTAAGYP